VEYETYQIDRLIYFVVFIMNILQRTMVANFKATHLNTLDKRVTSHPTQRVRWTDILCNHIASNEILNLWMINLQSFHN